MNKDPDEPQQSCAWEWKTETNPQNWWVRYHIGSANFLKHTETIVCTAQRHEFNGCSGTIPFRWIHLMLSIHDTPHHKSQRNRSACSWHCWRPVVFFFYVKGMPNVDDCISWQMTFVFLFLVRTHKLMPYCLWSWCLEIWDHCLHCSACPVHFPHAIASVPLLATSAQISRTVSSCPNCWSKLYISIGFLPLNCSQLSHCDTTVLQ